MAQGEADGLIKPEIQENYVAQLKEDGQKVDFRTYPGRGHMELVEGDSPFLQELIDWTR
ncbi:alpha/beta hydrolase [Neomicrococcus lactis]|uniref:Pimeloyl-ACP methyl ester carboxylesterase n=1 Tax=Neomicrococcus lactis TaxID=732241 RepID=A0A7W8YAN6_9MICC|nr:pimeloyl-ACP methyl ester carboxylesterase [Neomicrococcus lactis]